MTLKKKRRLYILLTAMLGLGAATVLVLTAFQDNLVFFYSPTDLKQAINRIDQIQWMNIPADQKKQILSKEIALTSHLNRTMIDQYGLGEGTILDYLPKNMAFDH